ncbi:hypothetical protein Tco_0557038 [Tanacetum coccineum]
MIRVPVTIKILVITNLHSILRVSHNSSTVMSSVEQQQFDCCEVCGGPHYSSDCQTRNQLVYEPNPGNNYVFPCFDQPPQYHIDPSPPQDLDSHSHCMLLNLRGVSITRRYPLMGDEVISTIPVRETDEFIKFSVDDLVPILRESKVTSDGNLECDMPATTPLPTTDVREENLDINLPLGEHLDTLSTRDRESLTSNPVGTRKN